MFKKNTALFVLFFLSIIPMKSHSSNGEKFVEMQLNNRIGLIELQARNILSYQEEFGSNQLKLVLGAEVADNNNLGSANASLELMSRRFSEEYIFANIKHRMPQNRRAITLDFNSLEELRALSQTLAGKFDMIVFDASTYKFAEWSTSHMNFFRELLKPGGQLIFNPSWRTIKVMKKSSAKDWPQFLKETLDLSADNIIKTFQIPTRFIVEKSEIKSYRTEIDAIKDKLVEMKKLDLTPKGRRGFMSRHDLPNIKDDYFGLSEEEKDLHILQSIRGLLFSREFAREVLIPQHLIPLVEGVFGEGHVEIAYDHPLPFPTNHAVPSYLVTATKQEN